MNLKLMLPAVKYKDIPVGRLFTTYDCLHLYSMTFEKTGNDEQIPVAIHINGENSTDTFQVNQPFGGTPIVKQTIQSGNLMTTFGVVSEQQLMNMDCYLVAIEGKITEIKN